MRRRAGLACLLLATVLVVAGCEEGDEAFVRDFLLDWASEDIGGTLGGVTGLGKGNEVTAILDAVSTIDKVNKADGLMDQGRELKSTAKMDEAIALRPKDWTYRTSRAVLALDLGSLGQYDAGVKQAQELSPNRTIGGSTVSGSDREVRQRFQELGQVELRLNQELNARTVRDGERCSKIYGEMAAMAAQLQNAARTAGNQVEFDRLGNSRLAYADRQRQCPST